MLDLKTNLPPLLDNYKNMTNQELIQQKIDNEAIEDSKLDEIEDFMEVVEDQNFKWNEKIWI